MALVFATFWWLDRLRDRGWPAASPRQLTILGALMAAVFNTRREGAAVVIAVAAVMAVDLVRQRDVATRRVIVRPFAAAALIVVGFQLLLPSELRPDYYNNRFSHIWPKISGPFRIAFNQHLGLANNARFTLGVVLVLMILGIVLRLWRHLAEDLGFVVFAAFSLVTIGVTPYNEVRYLLPLTPFAVYFMVQALPALAEAWRRPQLVATARIGAAMLALGIIALNLSDVPGNVGEARRFNDRGKVVWGPENPTVTPVFDAVRTVTRTGDVIAFMKARAMTLYTNRRAVQSSDLEVILQRADYFAMLRGSSFSQPNIISEAEGNQHGLTIVWQDSTWILWRVHHP